MSKSKTNDENEEQEIQLPILRERFAQEFVKTGMATKAYRIVYDVAAKNSSKVTIGREAHRLRNDPLVAERIKQIQAEHANYSKASIQWALTMLMEAAETAQRKGATYGLVQAISEINRMLGYHKTEELGNISVAINTQATIPDNGREVKK